MSHDAERRPVMLEEEWAAAVAVRSKLGEEAVEQVAAVLAKTGVTAGRPPGQLHSLRVTSVYFAGIKYLKDDLDKAQVRSEPFAFHHAFTSGMTVFATDGVNSAGKSTILGVVLWALRGEVVQPTITGDVQNDWLREAAVCFDLDGETLLVAWRVIEGRAVGGVYTAGRSGVVDLSALVEDALAVGADEIANPFDAARTDGAPEDRSWPVEELMAGLVTSGPGRLLADFSGEVQFKAAVAAVLMPRLDLEPIKVWTKRVGAVDEHDARVVNHGWPMLAQALSIINPANASVLGEVPTHVNQLLSVFLGSSWSATLVTARWQLARLRAEAAGIRRRASSDDAARSQSSAALATELQAALAELTTLSNVPSHDEVVAASRTATSDALALSRAQTEAPGADRSQRDARMRLREAEADLHALTEAAATRRFWHSVRPSCCPRCDRQIEDTQWAREQDGHCSLCDGPLEATTTPVDPGEPVAGASAVETEAGVDDEDQADEIEIMREQVEQLRLVASQADEAAEAANGSLQVAQQAAAESAAALAALELAATPRRREIELRVAALEGRLEERDKLRDTAGGTTPELADLDFQITVLDAAEKLALRKKDAEQRQVLESVSATITRLGEEFGVRHLVDARLDGAGHLPVVKGRTTHNFSRLQPGERLRLRAALIVALLEAGDASGTRRHPGLLVIDDLTGHEINRDDAAAIARRLSHVDGLQLITASTYGTTLRNAVGADAAIVTPAPGNPFMF